MEMLWQLRKAILFIGFMVVTIAFGISIFYNWGFLSAFGSSFSKAPISMEDLAISWVAWLPESVLVGVIVLVLALRPSRKGSVKAEATCVQHEIDNELIKRHRNTSSRICQCFVLGGAVLGGMSIFGAIPGSELLIAIALCLWTSGAGIAFALYSCKVRCRNPKIEVVMLCLMVVASAFSYGHFGFERNYFSEHKFYVISLSEESGAGSQAFSARIVRIFKNWMLVRDVRGDVSWIRLDRVLRLELKRD